MADVHSRETRSYNMSMIKGKNTKPEIIVRRFLFSKGYRFRIHVKNLAGHPDIVLKKFKTVIFVNGCFWHGHENCCYFILPSTRNEWWRNKIEGNKKRDKNIKKELEDRGWNVLTIWECELKDNQEKKLNELLEYLKSVV